jgi:hypothetical protein
MGRTFLIAALALLAAAPAAHAADARARLTTCEPALERQERSASFTGDMRAIPGASRLQVKFILQARTEDERGWTAVAAPGFGGWNSSAPGIGRYVYTKTVEELLAPASYRAQMHFRWLSATGRTLARVRRTSRTCRQPDLRPDLVAERLVGAGDGWHVTIRNNGRTPAYSFTVEVEADGQVYEFGYVEELGPRGTVNLQRPAPPCRPGTNLVIRVDADGVVDEADEQANELSQACPT